MAESSDPVQTLGASAARPTCEHHQDAAPVGRHDPALAGEPTAVGPGRSRYLSRQQGEGGRRLRHRYRVQPQRRAELPHASSTTKDSPREYTLSTVTTTIEVQTRISDLYRSPMDQVREQLGVLIEMVKERQENELVNNANYGLLSSVAPEMKVSTRGGAPTPDDLDELLTKVWKSRRSSWRTPARSPRLGPRMHAPRCPRHRPPTCSARLS